MKIKKKVKRISSVVLCMLMLLTALPMTAITANAAAQAYIKYIDTEVYIGDVLNIIVGVNGGSTDETFTYQWQAKYPSLSWVNLSDKTNRPNSKFSGVFTDHLKFQTYAELVATQEDVIEAPILGVRLNDDDQLYYWTTTIGNCTNWLKAKVRCVSS